MKAITYYSSDDIRVESRDIPTITANELLVKVYGCGLCGSDILKIVQQAPPPVSLGHELTGTIVARGLHVTKFSVGQRVVVAHHVPCGDCHYCRHGNHSMCASFKSSNIDPCGFAEYVRVPAQHVQQTTLLLPQTLSDEECSFVEPLACCVRAVRRTPLLPGDTIVVIGLGSIGLLMLQAFKALAPGIFTGGFSSRLPWATLPSSFPECGWVPTPLHTAPAPTGYGRIGGGGDAIHIYGIDLIPGRLELARELGADDAFLAPDGEQELWQLLAPYTASRGADAIIITAAGARPFQQAARAVRKGGMLHIFAAHSAMVPINLETIYQQELAITSTYSSSPEDLRIALALLESRKVRVDGLISHRLPLDQFAEGVALMQKHAALKVYFQIAGES